MRFQFSFTRSGLSVSLSRYLEGAQLYMLCWGNEIMKETMNINVFYDINFNITIKNRFLAFNIFQRSFCQEKIGVAFSHTSKWHKSLTIPWHRWLQDHAQGHWVVFVEWWCHQGHCQVHLLTQSASLYHESTSIEMNKHVSEHYCHTDASCKE